MGESMYAEVDIATLQGGAVVELVNEGLRRVIENVGDINTPPDAVRMVTLKLKIKPNAAREIAPLIVSCDVKLAPDKGIATAIHFAKGKDGVMRGYEFTPKQEELAFTTDDDDDADDDDDEAPSAPGHVIELARKG